MIDGATDKNARAVWRGHGIPGRIHRRLTPILGQEQTPKPRVKPLVSQAIPANEVPSR